MRKKPESIQNTELYHIRDEIVDWVLLACSALGIVAQTFATLRMIYIGFSYVIMSQNLIIIALIGITIKRKSIGLSVKTAIVLFIIYAIFLSSFVKFGFLASSKVYLVIAPIFSAFILGYRKTIILILVSVAIYFVVGFLFIREILIYSFDVKEYIMSTNSWLMDGSIIILTAIAVMIIGNQYGKSLISKIRDLEIRNKEVSDSEKKFRLLYENSNDAIILIMDEKLVDCNQKTSILFASEKSTIIGKTLNLYNPEFQPDGTLSNNKLKEFFDKAYAGEPQFFEWQFTRKTGELFDAEVSLSLVELFEEKYIQSIIRNITDQKEAAASLIKNEERFRGLATNIPGAVYRCQTELPWHMEYISDNIFEITGYHYPEFVNGNIKFSDLIIQEDLNDVITHVEDAIQNRKPFELEYRIKHTNGNIRWVHERGQAIYDNKGNPLWLDGVILDNTEKRESEKALMESEERFRMVIENIPAVTWVTNQEGTTSYISPNVEKIYGYTPEEIYKGGSELWLDRIHSEDIEKVKFSFNQLFLKNHIYDIEYRIQRKDGNWIWLHDKANLFRKYNDLTYAYGVFSDITLEKQAEIDMKLKNQELLAAEEEIRSYLEKLEHINDELQNKNKGLTEAYEKLEENENKYRTLFENANDGIIIMKNEGFVFCNKKMSEIFKARVDDIIGKTPVDFSPKFQPDGMESKIKAIEFINKALQDQPQRFEWLHKQFNGELSYAEVSLNKIVIKGKVFVQAIVRDISEKKQIERKILKVIVEAEERERERFAKELHDGLGPLFSTIKLYTQSAQDENDPKARESVLEIIHESINEAISSLKEISNNISPHILHNFGLTSAVNNFVDNIKSTGKVNISCNSNTKERFQDIIEFTVYRVLVELINNAVKDGQVKNIKIKIEQADNKLKVTYSDDSKGTDLIHIADKQTGMFNIQNRINSLNGQIKIVETRDKGMKVNILINLEDKESINN